MCKLSSCRSSLYGLSFRDKLKFLFHPASKHGHVLVYHISTLWIMLQIQCRITEVKVITRGLFNNWFSDSITSTKNKPGFIKLPKMIRMISLWRLRYTNTNISNSKYFRNYDWDWNGGTSTMCQKGFIPCIEYISSISWMTGS